MPTASHARASDAILGLSAPALRRRRAALAAIETRLARAIASAEAALRASEDADIAATVRDSLDEALADTLHERRAIIEDAIADAPEA